MQSTLAAENTHCASTEVGGTVSG